MTRDLTHGKILPQLVRFTVPLVLGNLFQLMYNAADSIIVGRFVGKEALASVGICNSVITLLILFLNGLCMGASILTGNLYGAGETEKLKKQASTTLVSGSIFSAGLSVLCFLLSAQILKLVQADASLLPLAGRYLRIILAGLIFTFLYNYFSSVLRALGDSSTPLYFLILSSLLNIAADLVFVLVLNKGCEGCAVATVFSQAISCLLCFLYIQRKVDILRLGRGWFSFDRDLFRKTVAYGWVSAMQQATVQLGKIGIQTIVNTMGVSVTAAFTAVNRADDFAYIPEQNIGHAMTAFMAQNRGAKLPEREKKGFFGGMGLEAGYGVLIFLMCFFLAEPVMRLFSADEEVIRHGVRYLHLISFMYILPAVTNGIQGYFRGIGDLKITLLSSFVNMGTRVIAACILVFRFHLGIEALPWSYLVGWFCMLAVETPLLLKNIRKMNYAR